MTGCSGCGVGPENECQPDCPTRGFESEEHFRQTQAALLAAGWSAAQVAEILQGRLPVELVVAPVGEIVDALTNADMPDPELIAALTLAVETAQRCEGDPFRMAQVSLALLAFTREAALANGMTALAETLWSITDPLRTALDG